tara:strand:+ start:56 stop:454 length:399 start_codon:yes stop_codon:yes gene_type:complete
MKKPTIYTSKNCGYCATVKDKFKEKEVEFIEKERSEHANEWMQVSRLTGLPTFPTIEFNSNYYVPNRDFQSPDQIVEFIKNWEDTGVEDAANDIRLLEAFKTLTFTLSKSFAGLQRDLQQLKQKLDGNESNN